MARRAVLVGFDAAPTMAFGMVGDELKKRGWQVADFVGGKKGTINTATVDDISKAIATSDIVLIGMSVPTVENPHATKMEQFAAYAAFNRGKPFGFYADTFGTCGREWFQNFRSSASFIFVLNQKEAERARKLWPNAKVVVAGNHEWGDASFPKVTREEIRQKLGVKDEEQLIFLPGHKESTIASYLLMSTVHAVHLVPEGKWQIIFMPHPLDGVPADAAYAMPILFSRFPVRMIAKDPVTGKFRTYSNREEKGKMPELVSAEGSYPPNDVIVASDVLVESCSTFCQYAAIRQIPIITVVTEPQQNRNDYVFLQHRWEPVLQGVSLEAYGDANTLAAHLNNLFVGRYGLRQRMIARQQEAFPGFTRKEEFEWRIANTLEEITA